MDLVVEEKQKQSEPWKQMQSWLRITFFNLCYVCRRSHRGEYYAYKCLEYYGAFVSAIKNMGFVIWKDAWVEKCMKICIMLFKKLKIYV